MSGVGSLKSSATVVKAIKISPAKLKERIREMAEANKLRLQALFSNSFVNDLARELGCDFRERVFDPATTIGLYVSQVLNRDEPCSEVVTRLNKQRKDEGLEPVSAKASAYCYARNRLPLKLLKALTQKTVEIASSGAQDSWRWHNLDVLMVDGFTVRAPDTDANQEEFPQAATQEPGLGYPTIRAVTLTSLATKVVTHFEYGPLNGKGNGELSLFRKTFDSLEKGQVIVGDSNFDSFYDIAALLERGVHCVFGINGTRDNPFEGEDVPLSGDTLRVLSKPKYDHNRITREEWEKLPATITIRIIAYAVEGRSEQKIIVTTLLDPEEYPANEVADLYGLRWEAELDIRCLKTVMDLAELRSQTPKGLKRELAVNVLAYNLVALLICDAADASEVHPRQISFSQARDTFIHFGDERKTIRDMEWLIRNAASVQIKNRPRREEPRGIKKRNSKYPPLKEPRPSKKKKIDQEKNAEAAEAAA